MGKQSTIIEARKQSTFGPVAAVLAVLHRGPVESPGGYAVRLLNERANRRTRPTSLNATLAEMHEAGWIEVDARGRRTFRIAITNNAPDAPPYVPNFTDDEYVDQIVAFVRHFRGHAHRDDLPRQGVRSSFGTLADILGVSKTFFSHLLKQAENENRVKVERNGAIIVSVTALTLAQRTWADWELELREFDDTQPRFTTTTEPTVPEGDPALEALLAEEEEIERRTRKEVTTGWESFDAPVTPVPVTSVTPETPGHTEDSNDVTDYDALANALLRKVTEVLQTPVVVTEEEGVERGDVVSKAQFQGVVERAVGLQNQLDLRDDEVRELTEKVALLEHNLTVMRKALDGETARKGTTVKNRVEYGALSAEDRATLEQLKASLPKDSA